jgi:hypothetical protein
LPYKKVVLFADMLRATGEDEDEINRHFGGVPIDHNYAPYGNKTVSIRFGLKDN